MSFATGRRIYLGVLIEGVCQLGLGVAAVHRATRRAVIAAADTLRAGPTSSVCERCGGRGRRMAEQATTLAVRPARWAESRACSA